ncbi:MAG: hypothetical protein ACLPQ0_00035, partial [Candidatus Binatus sp.]
MHEAAKAFSHAKSIPPLTRTSESAGIKQAQNSYAAFVGEPDMESSSSKPVAVITGVGPGLGAALAR